MNIRPVDDPAERRAIHAAVTEALPGWFGIPEANRRYNDGVAEPDTAVLAALEGGEAAGLIALKLHFASNADIYWMGVMPRQHRAGIGRALISAAEDWARAAGCRSMSVETLSPAHPDPLYARTREFYAAMGFLPLFELSPYGPRNPMLYMVKMLR
jgi:GNAT superfamily N-acetyltransferase